MNENDLIKQKDTEIDILILKNERLKDEVSELRAEVEKYTTNFGRVSKLIKSEARKELAERIKEIFISSSLHKTIDKLLAEMESERE